MVHLLKHACLSSIRWLGASDRLGRTEWRRNRLLILAWHGVSRTDEHLWNGDLYISPDAFDSRLKALERSRCTVLSLDEALTRLHEGSLPERAVVLTFDDGYVDFATIVWPAARARGYPVTVYLTTKRCEHNQPVVSLLLSYVLWRYRDRTLDGGRIAGLEKRSYDLHVTAERVAVHRGLSRWMAAERMNPPQKDDVMRHLLDVLGGDFDELARLRCVTLMNPDEVRQVSAEGADVQMHTHCHFPPRTEAAFCTEVSENCRRIEAITGRRPRHFCYPSGEYRPWHLPLLADAQVVSATTCDPGLASARTHTHLLPRVVDTSGMSALEFDSWLTGLPLLMPRRTRWAHPPHAVSAPISASSSP